MIGEALKMRERKIQDWNVAVAPCDRGLENAGTTKY